MNRRDFTKTTAGITAWTALSASRVLGANDRIGLALIGCGGRGRGVARGVLSAGNVEYRVMCDVWDPAAQQGSKELAEGKAATVRDFRKVLDRKDIDAVHIATPDHWHAIPAVLACQAGKDAFVEKPFSYTIREGQAIVAAARQYKRLVMVGTQHRSAPHIAEAAKIAQSGEVGDIYYVRVWNSGQVAPNLAAGVPDSAAPPDVDWDMYLGPAPKVPFNQQRLSTYRQFLDYNNGYITDYGNHRIDSVYQIMNMDWPLTVAAAGGKYCKQNGGDIPDVLHVTYEFPNFIMEYSAVWTNMYGRGAGRSQGLNYYAMNGPYNRPHGFAFFGTKGALYVDRIGYEIFPEVESGRLDVAEMPARGAGAAGQGARGGARRGARGGGEVKFRTERKQVQGADATELHGQNFVKFLRSRQDPFPNAEVGHKATATCLLGMIAWKTGKKLRWDGMKQDFIGDAEASKLLSRTMRKPWDLIKA